MFIRIALICAVILISVPVALAQEPGATGAGQNGVSTDGTAAPDLGSVVIGTLERRILQDYFQRQLNQYESAIATYEANPLPSGDQDVLAQGGKKKKNKHGNHTGNKKIPPGLARKGTLPPGLAMQLQRNHELPSGLASRSLPSDLSAQLPAPPQGTQYLLVDDRVLLVQSATNVILDTLRVAAAKIAP